MLKRSNEALNEILRTAPESNSRGRDLFASESLEEPKTHQAYRLKNGDGLLLPNVIIPAKGDLDEFFATIATYHQQYSPISSISHILAAESSKLFSTQFSATSSQLSERSSHYRAACLGLMIGEATLAAFGAQESKAGLSYSACRRTLSFALCRTNLLYASAVESRALSEKWMRLRSLTGLSASENAVNAIQVAHNLAVSDMSFSSDIHEKLVDAIRMEIKGAGENKGHFLRAIEDLYPSTAPFLHSLKGAFDGRINAFSNLTAQIQSESRGTHNDEICVAFLCNQILPGSFSHSAVLAKLIDFFPSALIWYGFFSFNAERPSTENPNFGIVQKLERDLMEEFSFEFRPKCDISVEELDVLARVSMRAENIRPSQQRALLVSLLPGVDVYTRFGVEDIAVNGRRDTETDAMLLRTSRLLEEALYHIKSFGSTKNSVSLNSNRRRRDA